MSKLSKGLAVAWLVVLFGVIGFAYHQLPHQSERALMSLPQSPPPPVLPDGTLIRDAQNERVYYMEGGFRRWITSAEALYAQGFRIEDIRTLSDEEVNRYPEGNPVDTHTLVTLPTERGLLPDIAPLAPYQLRLAKVAGRAVIKFTGSFWNMGGQSFWLMPGKSITPTVEGEAPVYERIAASDGSVRLKLIDNFVYHPAHHHLHLMDFGYYVFTPIRSLSGAPLAQTPSIQDKTTFCMRDDERMTTTLPGVPPRPVFNACGVQGQGVSVGWIDVYPYTLVDQLVDVQDMPAGIYTLSFMLDPEQHYLEDRKDNNIATTILQLDVQHNTLQVIAMIAPFPTSRNMLPDGMLIRTGGSEKIYVISGGQKRWLRSTQVLASYGYTTDTAYILAQGILDAIPTTKVIELAGTKDIYLLDDQGRKRHILTPEEFHAAGFREQEVIEVNQAEFDSYPSYTP